MSLGTPDNAAYHALQQDDLEAIAADIADTRLAPQLSSSTNQRITYVLLLDSKHDKALGLLGSTMAVSRQRNAPHLWSI